MRRNRELSNMLAVLFFLSILSLFRSIQLNFIVWVNMIGRSVYSSSFEKIEPQLRMRKSWCTKQKKVFIKANNIKSWKRNFLWLWWWVWKEKWNSFFMFEEIQRINRVWVAKPKRKLWLLNVIATKQKIKHEKLCKIGKR